jgi:outer membrane protein OmpA-like peptidoglycan-associated protein
VIDVNLFQTSVTLYPINDRNLTPSDSSFNYQANFKKMKKSIFLIALLIAVSFAANTQNRTRPWLVGVSTNYVDFHAVRMPVSDQLTDMNWMGNTIVSQLKVGRLLSKEVVFSVEVSMLNLETDKLNSWGSLEQPITKTNDMMRFQGQFEYKFANGYLLKEDALFDPYFFLGVNGSRIDKTTYMAQSTGIGLNIWLTKWLAVNAEVSYDYLFDFNDYMHYSFGIATRFNKRSAKAAPVEAVTELVAIAPDKDGDGVPDHNDRCPDVAGLSWFDGCPDSDGDGVPDHLDECADIAGLAWLNGCPDSDGDGIADHLDDCPNVAGDASAKGCPDADGDGVTDELDNCPEEAGPAENYGCPMLDLVKIREIESTLQSFADRIEFETAKFIIKPSSYPKMDEIIQTMEKYPNAKFEIEGHTDNVGSEEDNQTLSESRAYAVRQYFVDKGVDTSRLSFKGYGELRPRDTNETAAGRANNRRVEIRLLQQ